jgi:hypothetical protein
VQHDVGRYLIGCVFLAAERWYPQHSNTAWPNSCKLMSTKGLSRASIGVTPAFRRARDLDRFRQSDKRNAGVDGHGAALQRGENQAGRNLQAKQHSNFVMVIECLQAR